MTAVGLRGAIAQLERMPMQPAVRLALAEAEFRLAVAPETGPEEAVAHLRRAAAQDPYLPKVYLHLGRLLHLAGRHREAVVEYRQALRLAPGSRRAYLLLALALVELGRPERAIGQLLIGALDRADADQLLVGLGHLDALAEEQRSAPAGKDRKAKLADRKAPRSTVDGTAAAPDTWQAGLYEQLAREKPAADQVAAYLRAGAALIGGDGAGVPEYATACTVRLACGEQPARVRESMTRAGLDRMSDHPAAVLLAAALELAQAASPEDFVRAAAGRLDAGHLPPVLACWLHYSRYGPKGALPAAQAVRLLAGYPAQLRELDCFAELRLAVLDGCASQAWRAGQYAAARLLWRETIPLDGYRVPVALNLALLAARTGSVEDYPGAWQRLAELLYLNAAGAGDPQVFLEERRMLHLALSQQSMRRHCAEAGADSASTEQLAAWLADRDALEVWLREWDLYYLNSRLRFRSPAHLLGAPPEATAERLGVERDALLAHLDQALGSAPWAGAPAFAELAGTRVADAYELAVDPAARADDPYHALEEAAAKVLAKELVERARMLLRLLVGLAEQQPPQLPLACAILRRQRALPRALVRRGAVEHGYLDEDADRDYVDLTEVVLGNLAGDAYELGVAKDAERAHILTALEECAAILPHRADLAFYRCRLLDLAGRAEQAYLGAVAALEQPARAGEEQARTGLVGIVDLVAMDEIPDPVRRPANPVQLEATIVAARRALRLYPRGHQVRMLLVRALLTRAGGAGAGEAAGVLADGLPLALTAEQRVELDGRLATLEAAVPVVRRRIRELLDRSLTGVQRALDDLRAEQTVPNVRAARDALDSGRSELAHARELARVAGLAAEQGDLDGALSYLAGLESQLDEEAE